MATLTGLIFASYLRRSGVLSGGDNTSEDQRDTVAFVLDACGLTVEAQRLRVQPRKLTYWTIADGLTQSALNRNDEDHSRKLVRSLEGLLAYASMAEMSQGLVKYNLARLYNRLGDTEKAMAALEEARKEKVVGKRLALSDDLKATGLVK